MFKQDSDVAVPGANAAFVEDSCGLVTRDNVLSTSMQR